MNKVLEGEEEYTPKTEVKEPTVYDKNMQEIAQDKTLDESFAEMLDVVPANIVVDILNNPDAMATMKMHIAGGTFDDMLVQTKANKLKGDAWDKALLDASQEALEGQENKKKNKQSRNKAKKRRAENIKKTFGTGKANMGSKSGISEDDIWNMNSDDLSKIDLSKL